MKKLEAKNLEILRGGLVEPGPGEAERCRAEAFIAYITLNPGNPLGLTPLDFSCQF